MKAKYPQIVVAGLIKKGDQFLLVKERMKSGSDCWIIPGGKVEFGESLEEALIRELEEEISIHAEVIRFIAHYQAIFPDFDYHTIIFFFLVSPKGKFEIKEKGILDAGYFSKKETLDLPLVGSAKWLLENHVR